MSARARIAAIVAGLAAAVIIGVWVAQDDERPGSDGARETEPEREAGERLPLPSPARAALVDAGRAALEAEPLEESERVDRGVVIAPGGGGVSTDPSQAEDDERPPQTTGWRLGQTQRILGYMQDRLPLIEQAIAEAERTGDTERASLERRRLERSRERIAQLEAHAVDLEQQATADGTLADAEQTGPARVTVDRRERQQDQAERAP